MPTSHYSLSHSDSGSPDGKPAPRAMAEEQIERFLYLASHDLKAPLRAMISLAEWLREDLVMEFGQLPSKMDEDLVELVNQGHRMDRLLKDLLEYSLVGKAGAVVEPFEPAQLIGEAIKLAAVPAAFTVEVLPGQPHVACNPVEFSIAIRNLLSNSIKHHDKATGCIQIGGQAKDGFGVFTVRDDGPGVEPDKSEEIFQMFHTLRPSAGNGIGLGIIRKIVDRHGGTASVHANADGPGCTFSISFPLARDVRASINA